MKLNASQGYKKTKAGMIPVDWAMVRLGEIAIPKGLQTGPFGSQLKAEEYAETGIPVVMPKDIISGYLSERSIARIPEAKANNLQKHIILPGDIIFPRRGDLRQIGVALEGNQGWLCGTGCLRARLKYSVYPNFLHQYVQLESVGKWLEQNALGQTMLNLNTEILSNLPLTLPSFPEQKAIADLLFTWDVAIEKAEQLIAAKKKRFKWLLKKLITVPQEKQNGVKWGKIKLGSICKIADKQKLASLENHFLLTVKLHCLGIERNNRIKPRLTQNGRPYCQHKSGDFLIGRQNFHNGGFGIIPVELDKGITSNAISCLIVNESKLLKTFLWYQFSNPNYYRKVGHVMDGTGQKELSDKQILNLQILLPPLKEQERIVKVLSSAQHEINLLEQITKKYKTQKRGLMQKLLTGQWRVKISEEVA